MANNLYDKIMKSKPAKIATGAGKIFARVGTAIPWMVNEVYEKGGITDRKIQAQKDYAEKTGQDWKKINLQNAFGIGPDIKIGKRKTKNPWELFW